MTPDSPAAWLTYLAELLDARRPEYLRLAGYAAGDPPLPAGATKNTAAYRAFQRLARTNFAGLIVDAVAERMTISGFRIGDEAVDNDLARQLWRRSLMDSVSADVHRDMLTYGLTYAMASPGPTGAVLTRESPLTAITDHDPLDPTIVRAGLKTWSDMGVDYAVLHLPGEVHTFTREATDAKPKRLSDGGWEYQGWEPSGLTVVPMVRFANRDEVGEFAQHTDLLDRINWILLHRLLITAMQSFRQRAIKEPPEGLPETDAEGNEIDYGKLFAPGPDALWLLPNGAEVWESSPGEIQGVLSAVKDDIRDLAAVTHTPMSVLSPDAANQSAEGAALMREGLVFKAEDRCHRAGPAWDALVTIGLELEGVGGLDIEIQWSPCERQSLAERYDALTKATDLPWRRRMTDILGYPADVVDQMEAERASDLLTGLLGQPLAPADQAAPAAPAGESPKEQADALGALIRAGVEPESAAATVGLTEVVFTGAMPVSLRLPDAEAAALEDR